MAKTALSLEERQPIAVRAAIVGLITALIHLAVVFGLASVEQETAIAAVVDTLGGLVLVLWSIRAVTPNAKVISRVTTEGTVVAGDAAKLPTGSPVETYGGVTGTVVPPVAVKPELVAP